MRRGPALAVGLLAAWAVAAAEPDPIAIGRIRVQLYYEYSGRLSRDIAPPAKFDLWNVGAGEGSAEESASDILVTVPVRMKPADMARFTTRPITITARTAKGRLLGTRTFPTDMLLVPAGGTAWARLWLNSVQCAGRTTFTATYGDQRQSTVLNFDCGE